MAASSPIRDRFASLSPHLDERSRRLFAASEALSAGYGGIAAVARATGIAVSTIGRGLKELRGASSPAEMKRVRRPGGGRKTLVSGSPTLLSDLLALVEPTCATTTENGLIVRCEQDEAIYQKGTKVSDEEMAAINIVRAEFHGEWNYTIKPDNRSERAVDS